MRRELTTVIAALVCLTAVVYGQATKPKQPITVAPEKNVVPATQQPVEVSQLPPVSVTKDWMDRTAWGFGAVLVVVGICGVLAAYKTLKSIESQAGIMAGQLNTMEGQLVVMKESARQTDRLIEQAQQQIAEMQQSREIQTTTLILQYRPKIIIRHAKGYEFDTQKYGDPAQGRVRFTVVNTGGSAAHITGGTIAMWSSEAPSISKIVPKQGYDSLIPASTLQPFEESDQVWLLPTGTTYDIDWANFHMGHRTEVLRFIRLVGIIQYKDELGIPRRTGIERNYDPKSGLFTPMDSEGEYTD